MPPSFALQASGKVARHHCRANGFTLIEAMLVVALLGILTAIALPSFQTMITNTRVTTSASELQSLLLYARSEAVFRRSSTSVTSNGSTWEVTAANNDVLRSFEFPNTVTLSKAPAQTLSFDNGGTASNNFTVSVSVTNASRLECVRVTRAGLVQVERKPAGQTC
ncbi:prepilin-type N-terminal cleavage/methylation domain-containing protein [Lampropedia aestuarii]|uniref:Type II secretion system protein H n=1 Tax=Lampropedia aestuarii TaxID=2562762 RepID=A0A4S5BSY5_9BURK|nr:GspH/FimT family pseudopilin [Lampropedia aestuarii]THJ33038.1 prepilin-type N-terminal cleavage/methylation domain-containing protein [Lampropedia aestuarii]